MKSTYALLNAISLIVCGFSSTIIGGIISDKYEKKSYMTKSWVIIIGNLIGLPLFGLMCFSSNFYTAMICNALSLLFQSSYLAPAITMCQTSTTPENAGFVVGAYAFFSYIAQSIAPALFGYIANVSGAAANPRIFGYIVFASMLLGSTASNIFYYRAGKQYEKIMKAKEQENLKP